MLRSLNQNRVEFPVFGRTAGKQDVALGRNPGPEGSLPAVWAEAIHGHLEQVPRLEPRSIRDLGVIENVLKDFFLCFLHHLLSYLPPNL